MVKGILNSVREETEELGLFARKWVSKTFSKRCGMSIEKLIETIENLEKELENPDLNYSWYINVLEKLANYFNLNIDDAKGWIKDPNELKLAIETLKDREDSVLNLIENLKICESLET